MESNRTCLQCKKPLSGRRDKKFCDDQCRNDFNNQRYDVDSEEVKQIVGILKRNRKILADRLTPEGKTRLSKKVLTEAGFNFNFITHTYTTQAGAVYRYCFEYGYLPLEGDFFLVVKREKKSGTTENPVQKVERS